MKFIQIIKQKSQNFINAGDLNYLRKQKIYWFLSLLKKITSSVLQDRETPQ